MNIWLMLMGMFSSAGMLAGMGGSKKDDAEAPQVETAAAVGSDNDATDPSADTSGDGTEGQGDEPAGSIEETPVVPDPIDPPINVEADSEADEEVAGDSVDVVVDTPVIPDAPAGDGESPELDIPDAPTVEPIVVTDGTGSVDEDVATEEPGVGEPTRETVAPVVDVPGVPAEEEQADANSDIGDAGGDQETSDDTDGVASEEQPGHGTDGADAHGDSASGGDEPDGSGDADASGGHFDMTDGATGGGTGDQDGHGDGGGHDNGAMDNGGTGGSGTDSGNMDGDAGHGSDGGTGHQDGHDADGGHDHGNTDDTGSGGAGADGGSAGGDAGPGSDDGTGHQNGHDADGGHDHGNTDDADSGGSGTDGGSADGDAGHGSGHGSGEDSSGGSVDGHDQHVSEHEHSTATVPPPGPDASASEIDAYVAAVKAQPETEMHSHGPDADVLMAEHMAAIDLTPRDEATHVAVSSGDWFDASTWHNGIIPDEGAKVLIPEGINVDYAGTSDASLFTVRVDGALEFATDDDSRIVFDTMVVSPSGKLVAGTEEDPVGSDYSVELVVANNGPIDTEWDPMLLSRGVISHGETSIHGAAKDSHEKVIDDPMAGDTSVTFAEIPLGWEIGDTIVVAGTRYEGYKWDNDISGVRHHESEDEVRVITEIDGNTVHFAEALLHDHDTPRNDLKTSVANYTRNVSIETENGADAEVHERGHVMFMHSDDVDVRYAEFFQLGRTDKSEDSDSVGNFDEISYDTNVQGRYSLHLHRAGVEDGSDPVQIVGNAVYGSPGWGFVHHDSNADLSNNASFDTFGAGFVAETGNETGSWTDNIAINAQGVGWGEAKNLSRLSNDVFDVGRGGDGFWFSGRMVESVDNVAASVNTGFTYFHRDGDDTLISFDSDLFIYPDVFYGKESIDPNAPPILNFSDNETFAARNGLEVTKSGIQQGHDVWTHIDGFGAWSVREGIFLSYTTHYLLTDVDLVGKDDAQFNDARTGIDIDKATSDIVIVDSSISGFADGIEFDNEQAEGVSLPIELTSYVVLDTDITDTDNPYPNINPDFNIVSTVDALDPHEPDLDIGPLHMASGKGISISGTKYDSLGETDFPSGKIDLDPDKDDVSRMVREDGYWETSDGQAYLLLDIYFSDRLTGEIFFETHAVDLSEVQNRFGQWWSDDYQDAKFNGVQDLVLGDDGQMRAGDEVLGKAIPAVPPGAETVEETMMDEMHGQHAMMSMVEETTQSAESAWETLTAGQGTWEENADPTVDPANPVDDDLLQGA